MYFHQLDYNVLFYSDERRINRIENIKEVVGKAAIYHSAGLMGIKPWSQNKVNPLNEEFLRYANRLNPNFTPEKLEGIKSLLANQPTLFCFLLYIKNLWLPEKTKDLQFLKKCFPRK